MSSTRPPSPPKKPKRKRYTGLIWPKDTPSKPESPSSTTSKRHPKTPNRLLDLFTGRGPDIFLGNTTHPTTPRATWSNWCHVSGVPHKKTISFLPWPFPSHNYTRRPTQVYDFAARRYKEWMPEWHPADYPCAYCCCVPWRDCRHAEARGAVVVLGPRLGQRGGRWWGECYGDRLPEQDEHQCGCEVCRMYGWKRQQQQQQEQEQEQEQDQNQYHGLSP